MATPSSIAQLYEDLGRELESMHSRAGSPLPVGVGQTMVRYMLENLSRHEDGTDALVHAIAEGHEAGPGGFTDLPVMTALYLTSRELDPLRPESWPPGPAA